MHEKAKKWSQLVKEKTTDRQGKPTLDQPFYPTMQFFSQVRVLDPRQRPMVKRNDRVAMRCHFL